MSRTQEASSKFAYPVNSTKKEQTEIILKKLENTTAYNEFKRKLQEHLIAHRDDMLKKLSPNVLKEIMIDLGFAYSIKNTIFKLHEEASNNKRTPPKGLNPSIPIPHADEPLESVRKAKLEWEESVAKEVYAMAKEQRVQLCRKLENPKDSVEDFSVEESDTRFLYDEGDLLHTLKDITSPNCNISVKPWGVINVILSTKTEAELHKSFQELSPHFPQIGLDEEMYDTDVQDFLNERNRLGKAVLQNQSILQGRQFAKQGCPVSLRPKIWLLASSCEPSLRDRCAFHKLEKEVFGWEMITDDMYCLDVFESSNNTSFFPFEEILRHVMLVFSRDTWVRKNCQHRIHSPVYHEMEEDNSHEDRALSPRGAENNEKTPSHAKTCRNVRVIPPNGVQPFSGLAMYAAPLAYLFQDPVEFYLLFRHMYCNLWCKLNVISSCPGTLLSLCTLFERLLERYIPDTMFHLVEHGIQPLEIAFPWIQKAFSGVLEIDQVLLLWDRIIGFNSLELVPVMAAALFVFRSSELAHVSSKKQAIALFSDCSEIQVIPLLQQFLFPDFFTSPEFNNN